MEVTNIALTLRNTTLPLSTKKKGEYILHIFKKIGMTGCKLEESPIESNHKLQIRVGEFVEKERY